MARNLKGSGLGFTVVMVLLLPEETGKKAQNISVRSLV
jgi:hypothetical protein